MLLFLYVLSVLISLPTFACSYIVSVRYGKFDFHVNDVFLLFLTFIPCINIFLFLMSTYSITVDILKYKFGDVDKKVTDFLKVK